MICLLVLALCRAELELVVAGEGYGATAKYGYRVAAFLYLGSSFLVSAHGSTGSDADPLTFCRALPASAHGGYRPGFSIHGVQAATVGSGVLPDVRVDHGLPVTGFLDARIWGRPVHQWPARIVF